MKAYHDLLRHILDNGVDNKEDRTGHGRRRVFGASLRLDISNGIYPLITSRYLKPSIAIAEMLMFIAGETNIKFLHDRGVRIWDKWAVTDQTYINYYQDLVDRDYIKPPIAAAMALETQRVHLGSIGHMYGAMWRLWPLTAKEIDNRTIIRTVADLPSDMVAKLTAVYNTLELDDRAKAEYSLDDWLIKHYYSVIDQLNELVCNLKADPYSSRHLVTAYNPEFRSLETYSPDMNVLLDRGCLMPCHHSFQVFVQPPKEEGGKKRLSLKLSMRSADVPVGVPTNLAGYALLAHLLAHVTDMETDELLFEATDAHIYLDQIPMVEQLLTRQPRPLPTIRLNPDKKDLFAFDMADIEVVGYAATRDDILNFPVAV